MSDCWSTVGVAGDRSCPELTGHVHCRNCPVYARAAARLLEHEPPPGYLDDWTAYAAAPAAAAEAGLQNVLIFRVGGEWLAVPSAIVSEVAERRPTHTLPHRRHAAMLGLVNVRGELLVCLSLAGALGIATSPPDSARSRLLVLRRGETRVVCPVDEVEGLHRVGTAATHEAPTTVARASGTHAASVVSWQQRSIGLLDPEALFSTFARSLS